MLRTRSFYHVISHELTELSATVGQTTRYISQVALSIVFDMEESDPTPTQKIAAVSRDDFLFVMLKHVALALHILTVSLLAAISMGALFWAIHPLLAVYVGVTIFIFMAARTYYRFEHIVLATRQHDKLFFYCR